MTYKIVSENKKLIEKASQVFSSLDIKEGIHVQEIDFWLIDISQMNYNSIELYKNRQQYSNILFVIKDVEEMKFCLNNDFSHFIKHNFLAEELRVWCKYFFKPIQNNTYTLNENTIIYFEKNYLIQNKKTIKLTQQELFLLKVLSAQQFIPTIHLVNILNVNSPITIRTIINRIRKKLDYDIFEQKKHLGYKLKALEEKPIDKIKNLNYLELNEQNQIIQKIIDSSSIFIVSFIHKQLYCINKSFRNYLGNQYIKEIWDKEKGDFFQFIVHQTDNYQTLKKELFTIGTHFVQLYNLEKNSLENFKVETFYFPNIDKHLLIFYPS